MSARTVKFGSTPHRFQSLEEFLGRESTPSGNYEIGQDVPIHLYWLDRSADTTFVSFNGAIGQDYTSVPAYAGFGITANLRSNVLLVSDPSMIIDQRLILGWYAGNTSQPNLQRDLTRTIESFAGDTRLVLFGPSGGGYAVLEQATRLRGSTVVVSNPQTDVTKYLPERVDMYLEIGWGMVGSGLPLPFSHQVLDAYSAPIEVQVVYVQNVGDHDHVQRHMEPFLAAMHPSNRVAKLLTYLGEGHLGPDKESFQRLFDAVVRITDWEELSRELEGISITRRIQPAS